MTLECKVFYWSAKCFTHCLRGFNGAIQRPLATQTVIMLTSCWVRLSHGAFSMSVNGEPTWVSHAFVKKNMVRYIRYTSIYKNLRNNSIFRHLRSPRRIRNFKLKNSKLEFIFNNPKSPSILSLK